MYTETPSKKAEKATFLSFMLNQIHSSSKLIRIPQNLQKNQNSFKKNQLGIKLNTIR